MQEVINLISNVGFPIGAFCMMWKLTNGSIQELRLAVEKLTLIITEKLK